MFALGCWRSKVEAADDEIHADAVWSTFPDSDFASDRAVSRPSPTDSRCVDQTPAPPPLEFKQGVVVQAAPCKTVVYQGADVESPLQVQRPDVVEPSEPEEEVAVVRAAAPPETVVHQASDEKLPHVRRLDIMEQEGEMGPAGGPEDGTAAVDPVGSLRERAEGLRALAGQEEPPRAKMAARGTQRLSHTAWHGLHPGSVPKGSEEELASNFVVE